MFVAPYVFASGVKADNKAKKPMAQVEHSAEIVTNKPVKDGVVDLAEAVAADDTLKSQINERLNAMSKRAASLKAGNTAAASRKNSIN